MELLEFRLQDKERILSHLGFSFQTQKTCFWEEFKKVDIVKKKTLSKIQSNVVEKKPV